MESDIFERARRKELNGVGYRSCIWSGCVEFESII